MTDTKMTKAEQMLVDNIMSNLDKGYLWQKGWVLGADQNMYGVAYNGENAINLFLTSHNRGYVDPRWVTFNQVKKKGWSFKRNKDTGKTLAEGQGVPVQYFEVYDKKTKKPFDKRDPYYSSLSDEDKSKYLKDNVRAVKKAYVVFNCDLIDGVPPFEAPSRKENDNERIDTFFDEYSKAECPIFQDAPNAYYLPLKDEVHVPLRKRFVSDDEFYATTMHEVLHSTGVPKRLNRKGGLTTDKSSPDFAREELVADIGSLLATQSFGTKITDDLVKNTSAYVDSWKQDLKDAPNEVLDAVTQALKANRYLSDFEKKHKG